MPKKLSIQQEVRGYLELGIDISLNGNDIDSCDRGVNSIKENTCYMREYVKNNKGELDRINFTIIKKK